MTSAYVITAIGKIQIWIIVGAMWMHMYLLKLDTCGLHLGEVNTKDIQVCLILFIYDIRSIDWVVGVDELNNIRLNLEVVTS